MYVRYVRYSMYLHYIVRKAESGPDQYGSGGRRGRKQQKGARREGMGSFGRRNNERSTHHKMLIHIIHTKHICAMGVGSIPGTCHA